jgi:hypothetical protein
MICVCMHVILQNCRFVISKYKSLCVYLKSWVTYCLLPLTHIQNIKKLWMKIVCARVKFREKPTFIVSCVKREKNVLYVALFSTKFCLFTHNMNFFSFFVKNRRYVTWCQKQKSEDLFSKYMSCNQRIDRDETREYIPTCYLLVLSTYRTSHGVSHAPAETMHHLIEHARIWFVW